VSHRAHHATLQLTARFLRYADRDVDSDDDMEAGAADVYAEELRR
jgi:hypothetical protein